jgi:hypothetical protein
MTVVNRAALAVARSTQRAAKEAADASERA